MPAKRENSPNLQGDLLFIRYVPITQVQRWDRNPKLHDIGGLVDSFEKHGFRDAPIFDSTLEAIVAGNGRAHALEWMRSNHKDPPAGIALDDTGEWYMPLQFGIDADSREAAEAFGVDHNNLTMTGGDLTLFDMERMWDGPGFRSLLSELSQDGQLLASLDGEDIDMLLEDAWGFEDGTLSPIDVEGEEPMGREYAQLIVRIKDHDYLKEAARAIRGLLEENPEWDGDIK